MAKNREFFSLDGGTWDGDNQRYDQFSFDCTVVY